jgi:VanZ family protein
MQPLRFAYAWLAGGVVIMLAVLTLAVAPGAPGPAFLSDKAVHFLAFLIMMIWFCGIVRWRITPGVAIGLLGYGVLIELLQSRLSYRYAEVNDALFDLGGILLGWLLAFAGLRRWAAKVESVLTDTKSA